MAGCSPSIASQPPRSSRVNAIFPFPRITHFLLLLLLLPLCASYFLRDSPFVLSQREPMCESTDLRIPHGPSHLSVQQQRRGRSRSEKGRWAEPSCDSSGRRQPVTVPALARYSHGVVARTSKRHARRSVIVSDPSTFFRSRDQGPPLSYRTESNLQYQRSS